MAHMEEEIHGSARVLNLQSRQLDTSTGAHGTVLAILNIPPQHLISERSQAGELALMDDPHALPQRVEERRVAHILVDVPVL
jgi:hypothetical protein